MRKPTHTAIAALLAGAAIAAAPAFAAEDSANPATAPTAAEQPATSPAATDQPAAKTSVFDENMQIARALSEDPTIPHEDIQGLDVVNLEGDQLGEIDAVVTQAADSKSFIVITSGGFLGIGAHEVAVPFDEAKLSVDKEVVYVNMTQAQFEAASPYDKDDPKWSGAAD